MVNTRKTQFVADAGAKISGTCIVVDRDPNKSISINQNNTYTSLLKGETKVIFKRDPQTKCITKDTNEEGESDDVVDGVSLRTRHGDVDSKDVRISVSKAIEKENDDDKERELHGGGVFGKIVDNISCIISSTSPRGRG